MKVVPMRIDEINETLNQDKMFKWNKDINFMMSVLFLMSHLTILGNAAYDRQIYGFNSNFCPSGRL